MVEIRAAVSDDCDAIATVSVAVWREAYRGLMPDSLLDGLSVPARAALWHRVLETDPPVALLVAEDPPGGLVGFAAGGPRRGDLLMTDGEVYAIYVLRAAQARGIGHGLMRAVARELRARGVRSLGLWTPRDNAPARRFYERLGGAVVAEKVESVEGHAVAQVAYGWADLGALLPDEPERQA